MFIAILGAIVVLNVLVWIHELGHYLVAIICKIEVDVFSIGFGPRLFGIYIPWTQTDLRFSLVPIGGYVVIIDRDEDLTQYNKEGQINWRAIKRIMFALAGVAFNFAGVVLFIAIATMIGWRETTAHPALALVNATFTDIETKVGIVFKGSALETAGIKAGDIIISVDGKVGKDASEVDDLLVPPEVNHVFSIIVERKNERLKIDVTPKYYKDSLGVDHFQDIGYILIETGRFRLPFRDALKLGMTVTGYGLDMTASIMISGPMAITENVEAIDPVLALEMMPEVGKELSAEFQETGKLRVGGGPITIIWLICKSFKGGLRDIVLIVWFVSIGIIISNLLPLPGLDGFHAIFACAQMALEKPISERTEIIISILSIASIALIILWAISSDLKAFF